ncbi:MAG: SNF2-related protein [Vulcanimicrobiaceae bacterium]
MNASFDATTVSRGRSYAEEGRVSALRIAESGAILAHVRGSEPAPYEVVAYVARGRGSQRTVLRGACDCPMRVDCKHVVATLLALLEAKRPGRTPSTMPILERDPRVDIWLDEMRESLKDDEASLAAGDERIAYMFGAQPRGASPRALPVQLLVMRRSKTGRWTKARESSPDSLAQSSARAVRPADTLIGRLLRVYADTYRGRTPLADDLIGRIVATGRAHFMEAANPPLTLGPSRPAQIVWQASDDGTQRPGLQSTGDALERLAAGSTWYLDRSNWSAGPLDAGLRPATLAAILAAPPVSPASALAVRTAFERELAPLALSAPILIEQRIVEVAPVPRLALRTIEVPAAPWETWRADAGSRTFDFAELTFSYDGVVVDPTSSADSVRRLEADASLVHPRSHEVETRAALRLQRYPFAKDPVAREHVSANGLLLRFEPEDEGHWASFLHREVPALRDEGWEIAIEPGFRQRVVDLADDGAWLPCFAERSDGWFDLGIGLDVDGRRIELLPLLRDLLVRRDSPFDPAHAAALARNDTFYVRFANEPTTLAFPTARLRAIFDTLIELGEPETLGAQGQLRLPRMRLNLVDELEAASGLSWLLPERERGLAKAMRTFDGLARIDVPSSFKGTLRPYQRDGLDWLQFVGAYGFGGILADDMGLGKSVQTLAHLLCEREAGRLTAPALLIVPTSLVHHWLDESARFAPSLRVLSLHGPDRAERFERIEQSDLVITTYALLPRDTELHDRRWHAVVLDEAQAVKNPQVKAAQVAMGLRTQHRLALTGTPVENHLGDLWSLFSIVLPGTLGDRKTFGRLFRTPIEKRGDSERARALAARIRPFVLRRSKGNVAPELPEKTEIVRRVDLVGAQRDLYETIRIAMHERVRAEIAGRGLARSQIVILDALLKLRQVCCDPRLLPARLRKAAESAKLELLLEMLPQLVEEGRRILLFSQFTSMLALIEPALAKLAIPFVTLTGETTDRAKVVKRFQAGEVPLFLISLKAGGTGLNLSAADTVVHYDPWWNPAVERQATDRAHRIGQTRHVFVYKLIGAGTVEEKIVELQARKAELAAAIFAEKATAGARFGIEDIERLFSSLD